MRRELYGRGVIGLVKSSHWYQQLQESQQLSLPAMDDAVRVQAPPCAPLAPQPISYMCGQCATRQMMFNGIGNFICKEAWTG